MMLTCEHASQEVPPGVELGVGADVLASHVAWDQGAAAIARVLADRLDAPLFLGTYTRLYADLNRFEDRANVIPEVAFGVPVPGNRDLGPAAREARIAAVHRPWRARVRAAAESLVGQGPCVHWSIHSFTPQLGTDVRGYDMGILFDPERALDRVVAEAMIALLSEVGLDVRANKPYLGTGDGTTTWLRQQFPEDRYAGIEVETSHRWTERPGGADRIARSLLAIAPAVLRAAAA
jgi:predicted N-formylglutamate amidohydrolase